ncbi:tumor protein p53-inducible nuclear protein 1-like [Acipenser oxyrinchus oxyrinchus]|uniref:Tumor protein p53-inducible nuclear protein 1-like n=1 Tax=Acipenser oxyrinchus oxyrinchus TaxID=40147 RepID=A0AAD8LRF4_ACIOX|nr:tumor protein p53-inducible nuclear protein 1-like [Acipenser oxyrinchus oxyrinchus]
MFQRFTSTLFGHVDDGNNSKTEPDFNEKEDDDEWILVDYLVEACINTSREEVDVYEKDASAMDCPALFSSSSSLVFTGDPSDPAFLQLDCCALEESWFITPPPCFTAGRHTPVLVEASPMENLLIEHPSMSVYAVNFRHGVKETARRSRSADKSILRVEAQCKRGQPFTCYAAAMAAHSSFLEQTKHTRLARRTKENIERLHLARNALRRQNLAKDSRQAKQRGFLVHQPSQRQFNY